MASCRLFNTTQVLLDALGGTSQQNYILHELESNNNDLEGGVRWGMKAWR